MVSTLKKVIVLLILGVLDPDQSIVSSLARQNESGLVHSRRSLQPKGYSMHLARTMTISTGVQVSK